MDKSDVARESNEFLLRRFVAAVGYDYSQDYSPHLWPKFSEDTVTLWNEIEARLNGPTTLNFDREKCIESLRQEVEKQSDILKRGPDYNTSFHYGVRSGLNLAWRIVEDCIGRKDGIAREDNT